MGFSKRYSLRTNLLFFCLLLCSASLLFLLMVLTQEDLAHGAFTYILSFFALLSTVMLVGLVVRMGRRPALEQLDYYRLAGAEELSLLQHQALRLDIVSSFDGGFWNETLEIYPLLSQVQKHAKHFTYLPLAGSQPYRTGLHEDWGILDKSDYLKVLERLWAG